MLPITIKPEKLRIAIISDNADILEKRLHFLRRLGIKAEDVSIFNEDMPQEEEIKKYNILLCTITNEAKAELVYNMAKRHNILVNIEDKRKYCDFYYSSFVKRGNLLISINTNGKSPALSVRLRKTFEKMFPDYWQERLNILGNKRNEWKKQGLSSKEIIKNSNNYIDQNNWL